MQNVTHFASGIYFVIIVRNHEDDGAENRMISFYQTSCYAFCLDSGFVSSNHTTISTLMRSLLLILGSVAWIMIFLSSKHLQGLRSVLNMYLEKVYANQPSSLIEFGKDVMINFVLDPYTYLNQFC